MPTNRIVPALVVAAAVPLLSWAQAPAPPEAPAPATTEAEKALDAAIEKVQALGSVSATIRQDVTMLGQQFVIRGDYRRAGQYQIYLELETSGLGDAGGSMLQVSDGQVLWESKEILQQRDVRKRTLKPILEQLTGPDVDEELREQVLSQLGFAGPEALLTGLRRAAEFNQIAEGELQGKKVWVIRGRWQDREALTGPDQPPLPPTAPLPPYVPSLVYIWVGQDDGWPYRVELSGSALSVMRKEQDIRALDPTGRPVGRPMEVPDQAPSKIVLSFTDVVLNPELSVSAFSWQPPAEDRVQVIDETESIASNLTAILADRAARRRAEAAQQEEETLPGSLTIPGPPPDLPTLPAPTPGPAPAGTGTDTGTTLPPG